MRIILFVTHWDITENWKFILQELLNYWKVFALVDKEQKTEIKWVTYKKYKNEWYDFGKIYRFISSYKWEISELIYTNDTISILSSFKPLFDWRDKSLAEFGWATSSYSEDCKYSYWYHLQSFFHFFRGRAIESLKERYRKYWTIKEKFDWVMAYETKLTEYMIMKWHKPEAYIEIDEMIRKYWWGRYDMKIYATTRTKVRKSDWELNATFDYPTEYIKSWLPFKT
jgi:hypothetical protein